MEDTVRPKKRTYIIVITAVILVILAFASFFYFFMAQKYVGRFPEQTYINGIDVSGLTAQRAKQELAEEAEEYELTITGRDGQTYTITRDDIGLAYVDNGDVDELLDQYNPYLWILYRYREDHLVAAMDTSYDSEQALAAVQALGCFQDYIPMENAQIVLGEEGYVVQPEVAGTELKAEEAQNAILNAIDTGAGSLTLTDDLYVAPTVLADDQDLQNRAEQLNRYLGVDITLDFGDDRIVTVGEEEIMDFVEEDETGALVLNRELVFEFVKKNMAYQFDTFGLKRTFTTHSGREITLTGGDYGWCLDRDATTDKLIAAIEEGYSGELEPEWKYSAKHLGEDDMGGTYIEVSISEQMMYLYKDYQLLVETPVVTGNVNRGNGTPYGSAWAIDGMKREAVLGTIETMGYSSPVHYWMPFNGNVGIHDADGWRSEYGGEIYLTRGSHGCVNTPEEACATIFNNVERGTAVVVYDLNDLNANGVPDSEEEPEEPAYVISNDNDWNWDD